MSLSEVDVHYVRELVHERAAIVLDESKTYLIESRLESLVRRHGLGSLTDLVHQVRGDRSGALQDLLVDAMTTNETTFFRDVHPWTALEETILPELLRRRAAERTLTVWSAGCSSGQEPYSLAMLLRDRFPQVVADWDVRIIATDLSSEMLTRAAAGVFTQLEVNRGLPASMLVRHFHREGVMWQIDDELRNMVEFRRLNLCDPWPYLPLVDVVLLRNVLIYFGLEAKRQILGRVREVLRPGGTLLLGSAETTLNIDDRFARLPLGGVTVYQPQ